MNWMFNGWSRPLLRTGIISGLIMLCYSVPGFAVDSLRVEKKDGKAFVLHQVEQGETLYRLSKRYGVTVAVIEEENKELLQDGMKTGQVLWIPVKKEAPSASKLPVYHEVQPKETLYSLARQYGVKVDDIKTWNGMQDNALDIGEQLIVGYTREEKRVVETTVTKEAKEVVQQVRSPGGYIKVTEKGVARAMTEERYEINYYAYHKTAPVGTVLLVENRQNDRTIYVRVMGQLKGDPDSDVLMELSRPAWNKLGGQAGVLEVRLSYPVVK